MLRVASFTSPARSHDLGLGIAYFSVRRPVRVGPCRPSHSPILTIGAAVHPLTIYPVSRTRAVYRARTWTYKPPQAWFILP